MIGSLASVFSTNGLQLHRPSAPGHAKIPETSQEKSSFFSENSAIVELSQQNPGAIVGDAGRSNSQNQDSESQNNEPGKELSEEEKQQIQELEQRDREVRQHEQAHIAAAGGYAKGGPKYEYQRGPDGKQYAVGGEVSIDTSKESEPERTIQKAAVIRRAANAPAEPSGQDRAVAAAASQMEAEARRELASEESKESQGSSQGQVHQYNSEGRGQSIHGLGDQFSLVA